MSKPIITKPEIIEIFTVKSLKNIIQDGHNIAKCTVYFKGKLMAKFFDDGLGGGADVQFKTPAMEKAFDEFCEEHRIKEAMVAEGWPSNLNQTDCVQFVTDYAINEVNRLKNLQKIQKLCGKAIVWGTDTRYHHVGWKGITDMKDLLKYRNGLSMIQQEYDRAKSELKGSMQIFNTPEQLTALGVSL